MKATELRIGNYIKGIYETEIDRGNGIIEDAECFEEVRVVGLDSVNFSEYSIWVEDGSREIYDSFEGIPLTEEWLLKLGFKWKNHAMRLGKYAIRQQVDGWFMYLSNESLNFTIHLKYVHQLQNLYFALTGKELTI